MKSVSMTRSQGQVYSVGNYLMTGKVLGKGHFARVEEATHRVLGKKVAIKIIDLTCIKEEYARRNLHREPRVMARLRHPCIAALYETMMHGPRLYVVMEAACGGDLCAHVLGSRGARGLRGLPEARARSLAAQLVSAVRHMHARGVVHRDLKMENIMLDSSKQFIKIVDFGLSNVWCCGSGLRTPCGSLEYAAPELFRDGHRYGPEVDLWSIGVIVFGMVTGGLPFTGGSGGGGGGGGEGARSRPQLRAAIARGFTRKQRNALQATSTECKTFIQHLLEPNVDLRMKIEEAARHRWLRRPGLRMKTHPLADVDHKLNRDVYRQISEVTGKLPSDVAAQVKADPFGSVAGMYNIKVHHQQMQAIPGTDLLWSSIAQEPSPQTPPEYKNKIEKSEAIPIPVATNQTKTASDIYQTNFQNTYSDKLQIYGNLTKTSSYSRTVKTTPMNGVNGSQQKTSVNPLSPTKPAPYSTEKRDVKTTSLLNRTATNGVASKTIVNGIKAKLNAAPSTRLSILSRPLSGSAVKKQDVRSPHDNGDCPPRLPCIDEHSITNMTANTEVNRLGRINRGMAKIPFLKQLSERQGVDSTKSSEGKRIEFYRKGGDGLPSWKASGSIPVTPARILLQTNATAIKRASLGNIVSPHSSTNSHCKSDRTPIGWYASSLGKSPAPLQRFRKTAL